MAINLTKDTLFVKLPKKYEFVDIFMLDFKLLSLRNYMCIKFYIYVKGIKKIKYHKPEQWCCYKNSQVKILDQEVHIFFYMII